MGGAIEVESAPGTGSRFSFTVPLARASEAWRKDAEPAIDLQDVRVLIVDDNATNRDILAAPAAEASEMRPASAASGQPALDMLRRASDDGTPFTLILLDVHMPRMDGFDVAQRIHSWPGFPKSRGDDLELSGNSPATPWPLATDSGISACVRKPVRAVELRAAISSALFRPWRRRGRGRARHRSPL